MDPLPREVRVNIYKFLDLKSAISVREVKFEFKNEIDTFYAIVLNIKDPMSQDFINIQRQLRRKVKSLKFLGDLKDINYPLECSSVHPCVSPLLKYPKDLKTLSFTNNVRICKEMFLQILKESMNIQTLEIQEVHFPPQEFSLAQVSFNNLFGYEFGSRVKALHLTFLNGFFCKDNLTNIHVHLLKNVTFPQLTSICLHMRSWPDYYVLESRPVTSIPYPWLIAFQFLQRNGSRLTNLSLIQSFDEDLVWTLSIDQVPEELGLENVTKLTSLRLSDHGKGYFTNGFLSILKPLIKQQRNLESFETHCHLVDQNTLEQVVHNNFLTLKVIRVQDLIHDPNDINMLDLQVFSLCSHLECLHLYEKYVPTPFHQPPVYQSAILNVTALVQLESLKILKLSNLNLIPGDQLQILSSLDFLHLAELEIEVRGPSSFDRPSKTILNLMTRNKAFTCMLIRIKRLLKFHNCAWDDPGWIQWVNCIQNTTKDCPSFETIHYYDSRIVGRVGAEEVSHPSFKDHGTLARESITIQADDMTNTERDQMSLLLSTLPANESPFQFSSFKFVGNGNAKK